MNIASFTNHFNVVRYTRKLIKEPAPYGGGGGGGDDNRRVKIISHSPQLV